MSDSPAGSGGPGAAVQLEGNVVNLTRLIHDAENRWGPHAEHGLTRAEFVAIELHRQGVRGARGAAPDQNVTRVEVVDHRTDAAHLGRCFVAWPAKVELSYQDDGRTLKVFVANRAAPEGEQP